MALHQQQSGSDWMQRRSMTKVADCRCTSCVRTLIQHSLRIRFSWSAPAALVPDLTCLLGTALQLAQQSPSIRGNSARIPTSDGGLTPSTPLPYGTVAQGKPGVPVSLHAGLWSICTVTASDKAHVASLSMMLGGNANDEQTPTAQCAQLSQVMLPPAGARVNQPTTQVCKPMCFSGRCSR
jgi:hypothetical protein